jgi:hypothetical protein
MSEAFILFIVVMLVVPIMVVTYIIRSKLVFNARFKAMQLVNKLVGDYLLVTVSAAYRFAIESVGRVLLIPVI